jgi:hypothetical protein
MSDLVASLILKLEDGITGGLRAIEDVLETIRNVAGRVSLDTLTQSADGVTSLNTSLGRTSSLLEKIGDMARVAGDGLMSIGRAGVGAVNELGQRLQTVHGRLHGFQEASSNLVNKGLGAAAEGFVVYEPMKKYAEFENIVRHIGITEGLSGSALDARIAKLQEFFRTDALKTGQSSESVAQAYQDLTQMGIHANLDTIIQAHSRAATAYNTTAEALGPAVGALIQTMRVPAGELAATMSAMAQASKEGRFKIEDFSRELPGVASQMALLGMTGRRAADTTFAALETVMRGSSQPGQAAVNLTDLLQYIRSPFAGKHFAKQGINLHNVLERGVHQGDVLGAVLDAVRTKVKGKDLVGFAEEFGKLFHNQQAGSALLTMTQQRGEFEKLRAQLDKIDSGVVDRDFISAFDAPSIQMRIMSESVEQLTERLGQGFLPVLKYINFALLDLNAGLKAATEHYPRLTAYVLGGFAALLALGSVLGIIGAVLPLVSTGFGLVIAALQAVLSPLVAIPAILGAMAYDIYEKWADFRGFFVEMWEGVEQTFWGFIEFLRGVFTLDFGTAMSGVRSMGSGLAKLYSGYWDAVKLVFMDFVHWVDSWASGLGTRVIDGITSGWSAVTGGIHGLMGRLEGEFDNSKLGRLLGLAEAKTAAPAAANDNAGKAAVQSTAVHGSVDIRVHAEQGTAVTGAQASGAVNVQAPISAPSRGATVGRP